MLRLGGRGGTLLPVPTHQSGLKDLALTRVPLRPILCSDLVLSWHQWEKSALLDLSLSHFIMDLFVLRVHPNKRIFPI